MNNKISVKMISFLLAFAIMFAFFLPISSAAAAESTLSDKDTVSAENEATITEYNEITEDELVGGISEVEQLREENVKHFRMPDGTYKAVVYAHPVHRKNGYGVWENIDNSLYIRSVGNDRKYATRDMRLAFSKSFSFDNTLFSLNENGFEISMTFEKNDDTAYMTVLATNNVEAVLEESLPSLTIDNLKSIEYLKDAVKADKINTVRYNGVQSNVDIEYQIKGNDIKENIVLHGKTGNYIYRFGLQLTGLDAIPNKDGSISLVSNSSGKTEYVIPAPYMYDNAGAISHDVFYQLNEWADGRYTLVVVADEEWIDANERIFPITIDPTIYKESLTFDTYANSAYRNSTFGSVTDLWVGNGCTSYIKINAPSLPDGATFNKTFMFSIIIILPPAI